MFKIYVVTTMLLGAVATPSLAQDVTPFGLVHYGHFQKMMHMKNTEGVVGVADATSAPHLYGVGAPAHGTGEITLVDGVLWLDYGVDRLGNAVHTPADGEQAVLLVTAEVADWRDVEVPIDMTEEEMRVFILAEASASGIDTDAPFPFLLEGHYFDLDWHVLNGLRASDSNHELFAKQREHQAENSGQIVGFYSATNQGVFTHPGESWHLHLVIENESKAGHVDAISVRGGTILKLPAS